MSPEALAALRALKRSCAMNQWRRWEPGDYYDPLKLWHSFTRGKTNTIPWTSSP